MDISFIAAGDVSLSSFACSWDVFCMVTFFLNAVTWKSHNIIHYNGFFSRSLLLELVRLLYPRSGVLSRKSRIGLSLPKQFFSMHLHVRDSFDPG